MITTESTPTYDLNVSVANGKYTVRAINGANLHALRYSDPWRDLNGDGLVLALATEVQELREQLATSRKAHAGDLELSDDLARQVVTIARERDAIERENALLKAGMPLPEVGTYANTTGPCTFPDCGSPGEHCRAACDNSTKAKGSK